MFTYDTLINTALWQPPHPLNSQTSIAKPSIVMRDAARASLKHTAEQLILVLWATTRYYLFNEQEPLDSVDPSGLWYVLQNAIYSNPHASVIPASTIFCILSIICSPFL